MPKRTNRIAATAASLALVGAFGIGAFVLAQEGNSFDPTAFTSAYHTGLSESEKGFQANPAQTDAQANHQETDGQNQSEKTVDQAASDAFSDLPLQGQSGTTAYNVTGSNSLPGIASADAVANGGSNGSGGDAVGPVVNPSANGGENANANGGNGAGKADGGSAGKDGDGSESLTPSGDSYQYLPSDPEATKADPSNPYWSYRELDSDSGLEGIDEEAFTVSIAESLDDDAALYRDQKIDAWTLFCALSTTFSDSSGENDRYYQWTCTKDELPSYPYFRIDSWENAQTGEQNPALCPEGTLNINYSYRFTTSGQWHSGTIAYEPKQSCVFVVGQPDAEGNRPVIYRSTDSTVNLYSPNTLGKLLRESGYADDDDCLSALLLGWKEGESDVGAFYKVEPGRHVVMPSKIAPLAAGYTVHLQGYTLDQSLTASSQGGSSCLLQTLVDVDDGAVTVADDGTQTLTVPYGIQAIDNLRQDPSRGYIYAVTNLTVPASVRYVNINGPIKVWGNYQVLGSNPRFRSTPDGILTSYDGTEYLGIPLSSTELTVPTYVKRVVVPDENYLQKIRVHATADSIPQIDIGKLSECAIMVDDAAFDEFVSQNADAIEDSFGVTVAKASQQEQAYYCSGGMVYSEDELVRVLDGGNDTAFVQLPHTVKTGCFEGNSTVKTLVLFDDSDFTVEDGSLSGGSLETIVCFTEQQAAYLEGRLEAAGAANANVIVAQFSQESFAYFTENGTTTLLSDQGFASSFNGTLTTEGGDVLQVNVISPYAFAGDSELAWVTLGEAIIRVGANAFENCTGLQGVFIDKAQSVSFGANWLKNCTNLGFVGSNALDAAFATSETPSSECVWYCTEAGKGSHDSRFTWFNESIVDNLSTYAQEDGSLVLYGSKDGSPWIALGSGSSYNGTLTAPSTLEEVFTSAFEGLRGSFSIDFGNAQGLAYIDDAAFKNSGLSGSMDLSVAGSLEVGSSAFEGCSSLESANFTAHDEISLSQNAFANCTALESASFKGKGAGVLGPEIFYHCNSLKSLAFGNDPAQLNLYSPGIGYRFNGFMDEDVEAGTLSISVPAGQERTYLESWIYPLVGYANYDDYYNEMYFQLFWENLESPTDAEVRAAMAQNLLEPENRLRSMLGMPQVESCTIFQETAVEVDGYTYIADDQGITLVSAPADALQVDLASTLPLNEDGSGRTEGVGIASDAFASCTQLESVRLCEAVDRIESGAFNGCDSVTVTLPEGCTLPQLSEGSAAAPFSFGAQIILNVAEADRETVLGTWPMQCLGYQDRSAFESNAEDIALSLFDWDTFEPPTHEQLDEAINGPLVTQENYLRGLMGLPAISTTSELAYSYDLSLFEYWWSEEASETPSDAEA